VVNVTIHQFQFGGAVVDAAALAQFQEQWPHMQGGRAPSSEIESNCNRHRSDLRMIFSKLSVFRRCASAAFTFPVEK
jgi:hypothetical protein